jgi:hypothetical protein
MVEPLPTWAGDSPNPLNEPVVKTLAQDGWIAGTVKSLVESAKWNRKGALWSAAAVLLTGLSSIAGAFSL